MVFVMITMSMESAERIVEVLTEKSSLTSPENALTEVKDGSIDFDNVSFKYSQKAERMALAGVNLHIRSGEIIGILGLSLIHISRSPAPPFRKNHPRLTCPVVNALTTGLCRYQLFAGLREFNFRRQNAENIFFICLR